VISQIHLHVLFSVIAVSLPQCQAWALANSPMIRDFRGVTQRIPESSDIDFNLHWSSETRMKCLSRTRTKSVHAITMSESNDGCVSGSAISFLGANSRSGFVRSNHAKIIYSQ
jgi:hypothetical protein